MKIATFNINSIRNRLPRLLAWLASATPDVVCLQELRIHDDEFPEDALRDAGYGAIWAGQSPRYNGVAILARGATPTESGAACRAIQTTCTRDTSRPQSMAFSSAACTLPTAIRSLAPSSRTSSPGSRVSSTTPKA